MASAVQDVCHEIERPGLIQSRWRRERLSESMRDATLRPPGQIQPQRAVHAMHAFVIPGTALRAAADRNTSRNPTGRARRRRPSMRQSRRHRARAGDIGGR